MSSIIIRLQNMPATADPSDIRRFFRGLAIPDGGVHVVGGQLGDAFIVFATDEDARRAMQLTGNHLHGYNIKLLLSSKAEMQQVISAVQRDIHFPANSWGNSSEAPLTDATSSSSHQHRGSGDTGSTMRFGSGMSSSARHMNTSSDNHISRSGKRSVIEDGSSKRKKQRLNEGLTSSFTSNTSRVDRDDRSTGNDRRRRSLLPLPESEESNPCYIFATNLPPSISYRTLRQFFKSLIITDIKLVNDKHGNRNGDAYVKFLNPDFRTYALAKHNEVMEGHVVHLQKCSEEQFDAAIDSALPGDSSTQQKSTSSKPPVPLFSSGPPGWIAISMLPRKVKESDIAMFLDHIPINNGLNGIRIVRDRSGNVLEPVLVEMASDVERTRAVERAETQRLGDRRIDINCISQRKATDMLNDLEKTMKSSKRDFHQPRESPKEGLILLKGIPYTASDSDIRDFLHGIEVKFVEFLCEPDGKPKGVARVALRHRTDVDAALERNGLYMGNRWIDIVDLKNETESGGISLDSRRSRDRRHSEVTYIESRESSRRDRAEQSRREEKDRKLLDHRTADAWRHEERARREEQERRAQEEELRRSELFEIERRELLEMERQKELRRREEEDLRQRKEEQLLRELEMRRREEMEMQCQEEERRLQARRLDDQKNREERRRRNEERSARAVEERKAASERQRLLHNTPKEQGRFAANLPRSSSDKSTAHSKSMGKPHSLIKQESSDTTSGATVLIQNIHKDCTKAMVLSLFRYHQSDTRSIKLFPSNDGDGTLEATLFFKAAHNAHRAIDQLHMRKIGHLPVYLSLV